jgi:hypothetical protein
VVQHPVLGEVHQEIFRNAGVDIPDLYMLQQPVVVLPESSESGFFGFLSDSVLLDEGSLFQALEVVDNGGTSHLVNSGGGWNLRQAALLVELLYQGRLQEIS